MMATALNMSFKVPVGYFLLPDAFTSEKRAELLRNCIYHVNTTGAVVTNLVMDNCPVNYATFRRLYHLHFLQNQTHNCILYFPSSPKVNFFIRKRHFKNEYLFWTFNIFMHRFYNIYQLFFTVTIWPLRLQNPVYYSASPSLPSNFHTISAQWYNYCMLQARSSTCTQLQWFKHSIGHEKQSWKKCARSVWSTPLEQIG